MTNRNNHKRTLQENTIRQVYRNFLSKSYYSTTDYEADYDEFMDELNAAANELDFKICSCEIVPCEDKKKIFEIIVEDGSGEGILRLNETYCKRNISEFDSFNNS